MTQAQPSRTPLWRAALALFFACPVAAVAQGIPVRTLPNDEVLARAGLKLAWHTQVQILRTREQVAGILVFEGKKKDASGQPVRDAAVFVTTNHGQAHSFDADTGSLRWSASIGIEGDKTYPPAVTDDYVFAVSGTSLVQLERGTGRPLFTRELPNMASAGPKANDEFVFVPLHGGSFYVYQQPEKVHDRLSTDTRKDRYARNADGNIEYNVHLAPGHTRRFQRLPPLWHFSTNSEFRNSPLLVGDSVVICTGDGTICSFNQRSGNRNYQHFNGSPVTAPLATLGRDLFLASSDYSLYNIDLKDGLLKWRFASGYPISQRPLPFIDQVFVVPDAGGLTCIDRASGEFVWNNEAVRGVVGASKTHVVATDRLNTLLLLSRKTGGIEGRVPMTLYTVSAHNQFTDRIYLSTKDGLLVCLHETASPQPFLHPQSTGPVDEPKKLPGEVGSSSKEAKKKPKNFDDEEGEEKKPAKKSAPAPGPKKNPPKESPKKKGKGAGS